MTNSTIPQSSKIYQPKPRMTNSTKFEVLSFKLHFFYLAFFFFFILKARRQSWDALFIYIQVFKEIRKKRKIKESIEKPIDSKIFSSSTFTLVLTDVLEPLIAFLERLEALDRIWKLIFLHF